MIGKYRIRLFKTFLLFVLVFAIVQGCAQLSRESVQKISFDDRIVLRPGQFETFRSHEHLLEIKITDGKALKRIKELSAPMIGITISNREYIAKGNPLLSSSIPENCDYFYSLDFDGKIYFYQDRIRLSDRSKLIEAEYQKRRE